MIQQSSALRNLELILSHSVQHGKPGNTCAAVLQEAMQLGGSPESFIRFYDLLSKAKMETTQIKEELHPRINRYLKPLNDIYSLFLTQNLWSEQWVTFSAYIDSVNFLATLDALANYFHSIDSSIYLEHDHLVKLQNHFTELLKEVVNSDGLSSELKRFFVKSIEDILSAINRYKIDGSGGLEKSAKAVVCEILINEDKIKQELKQLDSQKGGGRLGMKLLGSFVFLIHLFKPTNVYDVVGVFGGIPDVFDFYLPQVTKLIEANPAKSIADIFKISEQKALPPSKDHSLDAQQTPDNKLPDDTQGCLPEADKQKARKKSKPRKSSDTGKAFGEMSSHDQSH
jgi:hypothetical protein